LDDKDLPILDQNNYVKETAMALWYGMPRVLLAGFWFSLISLPALFVALVLGLIVPGILLGVITLGPGWLGMCTVIARNLLREPDPSLWDFFRAFGRFFWRGAMLGGLVAIPLLAAAFTLPLLAQNQIPNNIAQVGLGADLAGLFLLAMLGLYVPPQIVLYDLGMKLALRNGLVLSIRHLGNTLGLLAMAGLLVFLAYKTTLFLLFILPAFWLVFVINNLRLVLRLELRKPGGDN
jgi:uncharacterized membrane protein YesL